MNSQRPCVPQAHLDPAYKLNLYRDVSGQAHISRNSSADAIPQPDPLGAYDPFMGHMDSPSPLLGNMESDRKPKVENMPQEGVCRGRAGNGEGRCSQGSRGDACSSWSQGIGTVSPWTGKWAPVKQERDCFNQEGAPQTGGARASNQPHGIKSLFSPNMQYTQPGHNGYRAVPRVGHAKRELEEGQDGVLQKRSKRTLTTVTNGGPPRRLPEIDASIFPFPYSGSKLGQILPCGEILGFIDLSPVAQRYDMYHISMARPQAQDAWILLAWRNIWASIGVLAPTWDDEYWTPPVNRFDTLWDRQTLRAIKTFRELGEKLWQSPMSELTGETLALFRKEMDYIVLLLLVLGHQHDRSDWEARLHTLFTRLSPAARPIFLDVHPRPLDQEALKQHGLNGHQPDPTGGFVGGYVPPEMFPLH